MMSRLCCTAACLAFTRSGDCVPLGTRYVLSLVGAIAAAVVLNAQAASADQVLRLAEDPQISPDGRTVLFVRYGDIWRVSVNGGRAIRLTTHRAHDSEPRYSPDGRRIAFVSDRSGSRQVYVMPAAGGEPQQLTDHSEGYSLQDWFPDGEHLLVLGSRDHFWKSPGRFMKISASERSAEDVLFDGYGSEGRVSPDGKRMVFVREGERWWRKGYVGSRSAQIWMFEFATGRFRKLLDTDAGNRSPAWAGNSQQFYFCSSQGAANGARNLWLYDISTGESRQLTEYDDDLVVTPSASADGATVVFSRLFDLYRYAADQQKPPQKLTIRTRTDDRPTDIIRRTLTTAEDAAFSSDGLEIAMICGGDLWVMETELKEPVRITNTPEFESDPVFADDGNSLLFVGWKDGQADLWKAVRADESKYWWQNTEFRLTQITDDPEVESGLTLSPNGHDLFYARTIGDLWVRNLDSGTAHRLVDGFSSPAWDVSPDGRWVVYSLPDNDFNSDVWIAPVDRSSPAVNISRHPDDDVSPKWSPDGKLIAFTGRRADDEVDIYYLYVSEKDDDADARDRRLQKALEKFRKTRSKPKTPKPAAEHNDNNSAGDGNKADKPESQTPKRDAADEAKAKQDAAPHKLPKVHIDFEDIHRRLKRLSIPDSTERILGWSPDGSKLVFTASIKGESGTYMVTFPDELTPKKISSTSGRLKGWLRSPERMLWLAGGVPGSQSLTGSTARYAFTARQQILRTERYRAVFDEAWRIMRDRWYDDNFGNHNWNQIRRKYADAAEHAGDTTGLSRVIHLMLGELNGSHLGFYPSPDPGSQPASRSEEWRPVTAHLGVRFDPTFQGPGLKVKDVLPHGPAADADSRLHVNDIILTIDGHAVDPDIDLTSVLNGPADRDIRLTVSAAGNRDMVRHVVIRPTSWSAARAALYLKWQDDNRALVAEKAPDIGYLHIQGMNWTSFLDFERELYDVGYGKNGLIIDVRDNGGGSTTDHLLTALTQPEHAITVPRDGGPGYPQSRKVYATWNKPIVVLCNQNSYSNAEIFSHAIRNLKRGRLVGVPTAGGVISTGAARVLDAGRIRVPFRGWFVKATGEDMELNGAVPHVIIRPRPAEIPSGRDRQLLKAIQVLQRDVAAWKSRPQPPLRKATERLKEAQ